jgi:hypothetical protein
MTEKVVWHVVKQYAGKLALRNSQLMIFDAPVQGHATALEEN